MRNPSLKPTAFHFPFAEHISLSTSTARAFPVMLWRVSIPGSSASLTEVSTGMEQAEHCRTAAALPREMENEGLPPLHFSQAKNGRFKTERESTFIFLVYVFMTSRSGRGHTMLPSPSLPHSRIF